MKSKISKAKEWLSLRKAKILIKSLIKSLKNDGD